MAEGAAVSNTYGVNSEVGGSARFWSARRVWRTVG